MSAHSWAVNLVGSLLLALFRNARASASFFSSVPTGLSVPASSHFTPRCVSAAHGSCPSFHSALCTALIHCFFAVALYVAKKAWVHASERSVMRFAALADPISGASGFSRRNSSAFIALCASSESGVGPNWFIRAVETSSRTRTIFVSFDSFFLSFCVSSRR
eukprot:scaffold57774_cov35-Phaeocystis_antarctica.AAC.4